MSWVKKKQSTREKGMWLNEQNNSSNELLGSVPYA